MRSRSSKTTSARVNGLIPLRRVVFAAKMRSACFSVATNQVPHHVMARPLALRRDARQALILATWHEMEGKTASAWAEFTEAVGLATAAHDVKRAKQPLVSRLAAGPYP